MGKFNPDTPSQTIWKLAEVFATKPYSDAFMTIQWAVGQRESNINGPPLTDVLKIAAALEALLDKKEKGKDDRE